MVTKRSSASYNNKGTNTDPSRLRRPRQRSGPQRDRPGVVPSSGRLQGTGTIAVLDNLASRSLSPASKPTISGDVTFYVPRAFGSHELQAGFYLQPHLRRQQTTIYSNGGFTTENVVLIDANDAAAGYVPYHRIYVDTPQLVTSHIGAEDYAFYVQDSWRPAARLTVSAGIRADWIASHDLLFDIETMSAWNIGPRIGATYVADRQPAAHRPRQLGARL